MEPLILTAALDEKSFGWVNGLRQKYFPPERNFIDAHVTLFHHLPGERVDEIIDTLRSATEGHSTSPVTFPSLRFLGRGVAFNLDSAYLQRLHAELAARWISDLTPQDRQKFRPHVTIQNKVEPAVARRLFDELNASFTPRDGFVTGLKLWRYMGGPWEAECDFPFLPIAQS